ncbi:MAG: CDP-alcohol phosphatidyltransferase family protein [Thermodesulfovibrionales bacterium]
MLGERFGHFLDKPLTPLVRLIAVEPNSLSLTGFAVTIGASFLLVSDLFWGALAVLAGTFFDILDGVAARVHKKESDFGAFLDSVLDRYSDSLIFIAVGLHLLKKGSLTGAVLSIGVLTGSLIISYTRARAEGLGMSCKVGLMERPERIVLLVLGAITGMIQPMLWLLLLLTHLTALQRIHHVWRQSHGKPGP